MSKKNRIIMMLAAFLILGVRPAAALETVGEATLDYQIINGIPLTGKFQEYQNFHEDRFEPSGTLRVTGGDYLFIGSFRNLSMDDRQAELTVEKGSKLEVGLTLLEYPHFYGYGRTLYERYGSGYYLPDPLQNVNQVGPTINRMNNIKSAFTTQSVPVTLRFRDALVGGEVAYDVRRDLQIRVNGSQKLRKGTRPIGMAFGMSNVNELPEPLDQITTEGGVTAEFTRGKFAMTAESSLSSFDNRIPSYTYDNFQRLHDTSGTPGSGRTAGPPDNLARHMSLAAYSDHLKNTRVSGSVAYAVWTQNDPFLPYTINSAVDQTAPVTARPPAWMGDASALPAPISSLNGRIETLVLNGRVATRPVPELELVAKVRDYRMWNKTPEITFPGRVSFDGRWAPGDLSNHHFDYQTLSYGGDVNYRPLRRITFSGGYGIEELERHAREMEKSEETTLKGGVSVTPVEMLKISTTYTRADRDASHFNMDDYKNASGAFIEGPGLRRYDVASRLRRRLKSEATVKPLSGLHATYAYTVGSTRYRPEDGAELTGGVPGNQPQMYGVKSDDHRISTLSLGWDVTSRLSLGFYSDKEVYDTYQLSNNSTGTPTQDFATDFIILTQDKYWSYDLSADYEFNEVWSADVAWGRFESLGSFHPSNPPGTATAEEWLPDTTTEKTDYMMGVGCRVTPAVRTRVYYRIAKWTEYDWASNPHYVENWDTAAYNAVYLGLYEGSYCAHIVGGSLTAQF